MKSDASYNVRSFVIKAVKICLLITLVLSCLFVTASALDEEFHTYEARPDELLQTGGFPELPVPNSEASLLGSQGGVEDVIYQALLQRAEKFDVSGFKLTIDELSPYYSAVLNTHPELIFVSSGFTYWHIGETVTAIEPRYREDIDEEAIRQFNQRVDIILSDTIRPGMTDLEKALALHDYLALHCAYNWNVANRQKENTDLVFSAYGAIVDGDAVCQGYALAYQLLLQRVGIDAGMITSEAMNHAWNWVKLDGGYYHVDVTWDDPLVTVGTTKSDCPGLCGHTYFLVDDKNLLEHYGYEMHCTDGKYTSGYLFSKNSSAIFYYGGKYYCSNGMKSVFSSGSLEQATSSGVYTKASALCNDAIYYVYTYYYTDSSAPLTDVYRYDLKTGTGEEVLSELSGWYGLETAADGTLRLVKLNGTANPEKLKILDRPVEVITSGNLIPDDTGAEPAAKNPSGKLALHNRGTASKEITVYAAVYNADNRQIGITTVTVQIAPGSTLVTINGAQRPDAATAKIFFTDGDGRPFCQELKLN